MVNRGVWALKNIKKRRDMEPAKISLREVKGNMA